MLTPALNLDFTTAVLDPRITFARSGNTATRINASGFVESINADLPRFDYNPATLACRGLLVEEQKTNVCQYSQDFRNTAEAGSTRPWAVSSGANTVTANAGTSPANDNTASQMSFTASSFAGRGQSFTATSGVTYTWSVWIKRLSGAGNGRISFVGAIASATSFAATGDWQRISITATAASTGTATALVFPEYLATRTGDYLLWGAQIEVGVLTSYIPNLATGTTTRNSDIATITGANFSEWWQASKGGVLVRARPGTVSGVRPWVQFDDGTANEIIALRGNATNPELYIVDGGVAQAQIDAGTIAANTDYSLTGWWAANDCKARLDSGAVVTDTSATIPTVTQARLGSDGTNYLNGHLASISYYDSFSEQVYTRRKNKAVFNLM